MSSFYKLSGASLVAVAVLFCAVSDASAQGRPGGGGPGGRGGFGFGGPGGGFGGGADLMLLQNEGVRKELGIVDEQVEKLQAIAEKQREQMGTLFQGLRDLSREERDAKMEELREKMQKATEDMKKEVDTILLPNQVKRLEQIARQMRSRMAGGGGVANIDTLATELKLSDDQKEKLRQKAQEVEKKLREKTAKLRQEAEDELLSVLSPEQRTQWKEMIGESFEFQWGGGGRQRGQGGPGGGGQPRGVPADGF